jgi:tetratricopeptide (TPR) repeat protein
LTGAADPQDCPYVGLDPFDKAYEDFFFGRERDSRVLADHVLSRQVTVLYGPSGVGKSSVINVGLSKELKNRRSPCIVVTLRAWQDTRAIEQNAIDALRNALPASLPKKGHLHGSFARQALVARRATKWPLLLILDQFEEYFLYRTDPLCSLIERGVTDLLARRDLDLRLLIGLREDSLHLLDRLRAAVPGILDTTVQLGYLNETDIGRAIREPIKHYNELYRVNATPIVVEDAFVATLIRDLRLGGGRPPPEETSSKASAQIELPYLQLTMTKLWDAEGGRSATKLRLDTLTQKLGGVQQIMRKHVDDVLRSLPETEQALCADVFRYLVTPSGAKIAYPAADLAASVNEDRKEAGDGSVPKATSDEVEAVLRKLTPSKTRLLKPVKVKGADAFELFHDVLGEPVLRWRREFMAIARLEKESRRLAAERDESRRVARQRLRLLAAAVAGLILAVTFGGFSFFAWQQEKEALEKYKTEQRMRQTAEEQRRLIEATNKQLAFEQERTRALQTADKQRAQALIAASSEKAYDKALPALTSSLPVYEKYGDWSGVVHTEVERGRIYALSGRLDLARSDLDEALRTATQKGTLEDKALALESEASLHERFGEKKDTQSFYRQALDAYRLAGDSVSVARIREWEGAQAEKEKRYDDAVNEYRGALERYRIAGDTIGVERSEEAIRRTVPWGFLVDLTRASSFPLRGDRVHIGRNSPEGAQNDINFTSQFVSRRHLVVSFANEGIHVDDERSRNGTTVNALQLPYGQDVKLSDGDLIALANTEVLQFTTREQPPPRPPPTAWAVFINASTRTYTYLTENAYSVILTSHDLRVEPGENAAASLALHGGQNPQLRYPNGEWSIVFEYKKNDYEYGEHVVPTRKWVPIDNLPARFVKLSADRTRIVEDGPAFQIVTVAPH